MTDAEILTTNFESLIRESPFRIAPERVHELMEQMGGTAWPLDIVEGQANFTAFPNAKEIEGTYSALLSLWAVASSVRILLALMQSAFSKGLEQVVIEQKGSGAIAIELKNAALALIRNSTSTWPDALPTPDATADLASDEGLTNNLFLAAASFVVLHECGHLVLKHQAHTALAHQQEHEADAWAVSWILEYAPDERQFEFRILAICTAFIWIGLVEEVRQGGTTHPLAGHRFGNAFTQFNDISEDSLALEVASYALKAFFDPATALPRPENARDAFIERLMDYSRRR